MVLVDAGGGMCRNEGLSNPWRERRLLDAGIVRDSLWPVREQSRFRVNGVVAR